MSLTKMGRGMCRQKPLVQDRHFSGEGEEPGNCIEEQEGSFSHPQAGGDGGAA